VADQLEERHPLVALDLRGRGDSDKPTSPYGMAQHARDVAAAMQTLELGGAVVLGHSMGAFVAVALAAAFPDLVGALVLVDGGLPLSPPPGVDVDLSVDELLAPQIARLRQTFPSADDYLAYWAALPFFSGDLWTPYVEHYLRSDLMGSEPELRPKCSEAAVRADFVDTVDSEKLRDRLANVRVPVQLVRAPQGFAPETPPLLPDDLVQREGAAVADLRDTVVAGTTHYSIGLHADGARAVADLTVALAEEVAR
jgi:pimeloyl-ACP methyl ester carboxylesterase